MMGESASKTCLSRFLEKTITVTVLISFAALVVMMLWGTADVVLLKFGYPLPGTINWTEILNVIVLFLPLAYVTSKKSHIVVDIIVFKGRTKRVTDFVADLFILFFCALMAWQLCGQAWQSTRIMEFDQAAIKIYYFPGKIALAFGFLFSAFIALLQLLGLYGKQE
jgi:TRAP-type C4-dicarboxylate transport system permease small subunit